MRLPLRVVRPSSQSIGFGPNVHHLGDQLHSMTSLVRSQNPMKMFSQSGKQSLTSSR